MTITKRFIFTTGAKGGVGKSFFSSLLLDYLEDAGVPYLAFDADSSTQSLSRSHPEAKLVAGENKQALDDLLESAVSADVPIVLADFRAGSGHEIIPLFTAVVEDAKDVLEEAGMAMTAAAVVANEPDSLYSLAQWADAFRGNVDWVFVRNELRGPVSILDSTKEGKSLIKACKPLADINLPALDENDAESLRNHGLTVARAIKAKEAGKKIKGITDMAPFSRLRRYRRERFEDLDKIIGDLIPG